MIRFIVFAALALAIATPAEAMSTRLQAFELLEQAGALPLIV